ncbi:unnamed protein product [Rotaria magnacalcarata]|uniref:G domain-containing protein n=1 Tax=Rotaria magnacalcarata TaxID=392030 RepID=A0A815ZP72_9BILA|nr:unnamed protein product [Rotaria magnacalcarata]
MSFCFSPFKSTTGYPLERKVIDRSGRLGSLYDASTDNIIDRRSCRRSARKTPKKQFICLLFSGDQSRQVSSVLRNIGYDPAIRLSIGLRMVTTSGISRVIDYNQSIDDNTRFLYYCFKATKEKLNITARKADKLVPLPLSQTNATHMITNILWGIEFLCIIQIPTNQSTNVIDQLLQYICNQLKNNRNPIQFNKNDLHLIHQLNNITVFGSEMCVGGHNSSILNILNRIQDWQRDDNFHEPLLYTMQPLRWLYSGPEFSTIRFNRNITNTAEAFRVDTRISYISKMLNDFGDTLHNLPTNFSSRTLNTRLKDAQQKYRFLLDSQDDLKERLGRALVDVHRERARLSILDNILNDQRYECLRKSELDAFRENILRRLMNKFLLIEKLKADGIENILASDLCQNPETSATIDDIDAILNHRYSHQNVSIILWYSSDRLLRDQEDTWKEIYQELKLERQRAVPRAHLVYVDFSFFGQMLETFSVVRLPLVGRPTTQEYPIAVKKTADRPTHSTPRSPPTKARSHSEPPIPSSKQSKSAKSSPLSTQKRAETPLPTSKRKLTETSSPISKRKQTGTPLQTRKKQVVAEKPPLEPIIPPPLPSPKGSPVEINVLLLGETGVGKSTFINAFVNYLKFDTLQQAEQGEPIVLIPVSFLVTVGDRFDEIIVNFGDVDSNEDHAHQGQSVTQQCKSYVFDLNNRFRLRLIDTPGIGDTRGFNQDAKNIDHILNYINSLPHLNAICLLLKPNASRLNVFFRSCVQQLITYLTPEGYNNILFCFTNARETFYAPGDTGPLLRRMLNDEHLNAIPFKKENTFCFDSESFRYLAARKSRIDFDEYQKQEYFNSWNISVKESMRLLNFIQRCEQYRLEEWLSPRKAALDIAMLALPLMETLRLIIYNAKLAEAKSIANQVVLNSNPIAIDLCTRCAQTNIVELGPFWYMQYRPPVLRTDTSQHRHCPTDGKHFFIESIVTYELIGLPAGLKVEQWQSSFRNFLFKCDRLVHYLRQQKLPVQNDPFQAILERFLEEEQEISQIRNIDSTANRRLCEVLNSIKRIRQENSQQLFVANENLSIYELYQIIDELTAIQTVKKQVDIIKTSRQLKMVENELIIPANLIKKRLFV